jgi:hypothetical protein
MNLPPLPAITSTLSQADWSALRAWSAYSLRVKGRRARRETNMSAGFVLLGIDLANPVDSSGSICAVENFAREIDLNSTGLNGWDGNGSIAEGQWVYLWLIATNAGDSLIASNWAFLASASSTNPVLPSGWTHKQLISAVRTKSEGGGWGLVSFHHTDDYYEYTEPVLVAAYGATRALSAQDLSAAVPSSSELVEIELVVDSTSGTIDLRAHVTGISNRLWSTYCYSTKKGEATGIIYCPGQSIDAEAILSGTGTANIYVKSFWWFDTTYCAEQMNLAGPEMLGIKTECSEAHFESLRRMLGGAIGIQGFKATNIGAAVPDQRVLITCGRVRLWDDGTSSEAHVQNLSTTLDMSASGEGGLDAGGLAADTIYYIHLIARCPEGNMLAVEPKALASTTASAPTMPPGYTHRRLVGWCVTDSSANLKSFVQLDNYWLYAERQLAASSSNTARTSVSLSSFIPLQCELGLINAINLTTGEGDASLYVTGCDASYTGWDVDYNEEGQATFMMPIPNRQVDYRVNACSASIYVCGAHWPVDMET